MDFFRAPTEKLTFIENRIKAAMVGYQDEQDRRRREEQRKADEAARRERERLAEQARKAQEAGRAERAAQLEQRASAVTAPVLSRAPPRVAGVQTRELWKFAVDDPAKLPREYLVPDESKIRRVVEALKGDTVIPGVRVWPEKSIAAGRV